MPSRTCTCVSGRAAEVSCDKGPRFYENRFIFPPPVSPKTPQGAHTVPRGREGGRDPAHTGPAWPNTCLFCSAEVSIALPGTRECPNVQGAKYCIACYNFAHIMELHCTVIAELEPWCNRISLEGLFPGGQSASQRHSAFKIPRKPNF